MFPFHPFFNLSLVPALLLFSFPLFPQTELTVSGVSYLPLAGQSSGTVASTRASVPANAPSQANLNLVPGQGIGISAAGIVDGATPDGNTISCSTSAEFGVPRITARCKALVGVFLADTSRPQPSAVDYTGDAREIRVLRPQLQQPFILGTGRISTGDQRVIVIPTGATRLFLAAMGTTASSGGFQVTLSSVGVPEENGTGTLRVSGGTSISLAGQPNGTVGGNRHTAPLNSPVQVNIPLSAGQAFRFKVSGDVDSNSADGSTFNCTTDREFGVSMLQSRCRSLVGIFLADSARTLPPDVNYSGDSRQLTIQRPLIQQPFLIGTGRTVGGDEKVVITPGGATRLFLAVVGQPNSSGAFQVETLPAQVPEIPGNPVRVSGPSYLPLAGQESGRTAEGRRSAPLNSPHLVEMPLIAGQALRITATGTVDGVSADGNTLNCSITPENAISRIQAKCDSLVGVFLADNIRPQPPAVDYTGALRNQDRIEPLIQQPFLIGGGFTADGALKRFIVPAGATRLYLGSTSDAGAAGSFTATVSPEAPTTPVLQSSGITRGAGFGSGSPAPGSIAAIFGSNFASSTVSASAVPLPTLLGQTRVYFNLRPAPLYFTSSGQVNAQVPWELASETSAQVVITRNGAASMPVNVRLAPSAPGIFVIREGVGVVVDQAGRLIDAQTATRKGEVLVIYASGLGPVNGATASGNPASTTELQPTQSPTECLITGGGRNINASIFFSGLAPGFIGVYQVNAQIPEDAPSGVVQLRLRNAGVESNTVQIAIQ